MRKTNHFLIILLHFIPVYVLEALCVLNLFTGQKYYVMVATVCLVKSAFSNVTLESATARVFTPWRSVSSTNRGLIHCFAGCHSGFKKVMEKMLGINILALSNHYMHTTKLYPMQQKSHKLRNSWISAYSIFTIYIFLLLHFCLIHNLHEQFKSELSSRQCNRRVATIQESGRNQQKHSVRINLAVWNLQRRMLYSLLSLVNYILHILYSSKICDRHYDAEYFSPKSWFLSIYQYSTCGRQVVL